MKESKIVNTIISNIGDRNSYKDTSDYFFEILLPSRKELISFAEEYYILEDSYVKALKEDQPYCELLVGQLDNFSNYIINNQNDNAINEFMALFENIKNNYCIRLNNAKILSKINPDLYHN